MKKQNPWAGLSSYEDPNKSSHKIQFCGRYNDTYDVARLIDDNIIVTLYGKSGIGKTSLLNAGVFPALRQEQYTPLSLRLGMAKESPSFQDFIISSIEQIFKEGFGSIQIIKVVEELKDHQAPDFLWNYFARHRFFDAQGNRSFPVIVLDQFEEVFRNNQDRENAEILLSQLHYLSDEGHTINDCIVDGKDYFYDFNFRFVLSIREDDLYRLEDSIDNCSLTALKRCRYRLRSLSEQDAKDVILIPGNDLFNDNEKDEIVNTIIGISRNKDNQTISTNILSLICYRIFEEFYKTPSSQIDLKKVNNFTQKNPFELFYNEATHGLSNREKSYIENHFIDSNGRRNSISEKEFLLHVKNGEILIDGPHKILQRTSTSTDGSNYRIELIHDSFCEPLAALKQKRILRRRWKIMLISLCVALISVGIAIYVAALNHSMQINNARFVSEKVNDLTSEGDSYTARQLALYVLENRPYVIEAEAALRNASYHNSAILRGHNASIISVKFSTDGKQIVSQSSDSIEITWDANNGDIIKKKKKTSIATENPYALSPDGVLSVQLDPNNETLFSVYNIRTHKTSNPFGEHSDKEQRDEGHEGKVNTTCFSPNGKFLASGSTDNTIILWNVKKESRTKIFKGHTNHVTCLSFSPDGNKLVSGSNDKTIRIWDIQCANMESKELQQIPDAGINISCINQDRTHLASANYLDRKIYICNLKDGKGYSILTKRNKIICTALSPSNKYIACSYQHDSIVRILDAKNGLETHSLPYHRNNVTVLSFSPNGKYFVSASRDIIKLWDTQSFKLLKSLKGHRKQIKDIVFDKKSNLIASISKDSTIKIWNCKTGECLNTLAGHKDEVTFASFNSTSQQIVSTSNDNTIRIWDVQSGKQLKELEGHTDKTKFVLFYAGDSLLVSASNRLIRVWDISSGTIMSNMEGHNGIISSFFINPDGNRICSIYNDGEYERWLYPSLQELVGNTKKQFGETPLSPQKRKTYYIE